MTPFCGAVQKFERPNFNKILLGKGTKEKARRLPSSPDTRNRRQPLTLLSRVSCMERAARVRERT
jgi:hypothetical protein